jgi:hypothetical protein
MMILTPLIPMSDPGDSALSYILGMSDKHSLAHFYLILSERSQPPISRGHDHELITSRS